MSTTDDTNAARRGSGSNDLLGLVERLRFLASGQDDQHSVALTEAADEIERLRGALLDIATAALESPYREQMALEQALASLIAHHVEFLKA